MKMKMIMIRRRMAVPGNFLGLRKGINFAPIANAIGGPNMNPLASIPVHIHEHL